MPFASLFFGKKTKKAEKSPFKQLTILTERDKMILLLFRLIMPF